MNVQTPVTADSYVAEENRSKNVIIPTDGLAPTGSRARSPLSDKVCRCGRAYIPVRHAICRICNREYKLKYRESKGSLKVRFEALQKLVADLLRTYLLDCPETKRAFIHRFGANGTCTLRNRSNTHGVTKPVRVVAIAFKPGFAVTVQGEEDPAIFLTVPMADLDPDDRRPPTQPKVRISPPDTRDLAILKALVKDRPVEGLLIQTPASTAYAGAVQRFIETGGIQSTAGEPAPLL